MEKRIFAWTMKRSWFSKTLCLYDQFVLLFDKNITIIIFNTVLFEWHHHKILVLMMLLMQHYIFGTVETMVITSLKERLFVDFLEWKDNILVWKNASSPFVWCELRIVHIRCWTVKFFNFRDFSNWTGTGSNYI